jgi:hypothetical protein
MFRQLGNLAALMLVAWALHAGSAFGLIPIPGPGPRLHPVAAFDDSTYLIVWEDLHKSQESDIMGTRMNELCTVLDPDGIRVCAAAGNQSSPAVVANGDVCLVVWEDWRNGNLDIYGTRVRYGSVLESQGIPIRVSSGTAQFPAVARGPTGFLVVWQESPPDSEPRIMGARVAQSGSVQDTIPIRVSQAQGWQSRPKAAYDDVSRNWAVVWEAHSGSGDSVLVHGARISEGGTVLDPEGRRICAAASHQTEPSIAFSHDYRGWFSLFAVWQDDRLDSVAIYGTWIDTGLVATRPQGVVIDSSGRTQRHPVVGFDCYDIPQPEFLCVWQEHRNGRYWQILDAGINENSITPWGYWQIRDSFDLTWPAFIHGYPYLHPHHPGSSLTVMAGDGPPIGGGSAIYYAQAFEVGIAERSNPVRDQRITLSLWVTGRLCRVSWTGAAEGRFDLRVFDISGRLRKSIALGVLGPGEQSFLLDVSDLPAAVYFVQVSAGSMSVTGRLLVNR